jgi:DNA-binding NarL/FixJ family response regulator
VILDFSLPGMNGSKVFDEIGGINPRARVLLSTGRGEDDIVKGMLARGLRGTIPKPYSIENLLEKTRYTLDLPGSSLLTAGRAA